MEIEFITNDEVSAKNFAVEPMKNNLPEWYKKIPTDIGEETIEYYLKNPDIKTTTKTIKGCMPVLDYLTSGYVIKANHTILLKSFIVNNDMQNIVYYGTCKHAIQFHTHQQCPISMKGLKRTYIKIRLGWRVKTPKGYSCLFYQPYYSSIEKKFDLFPAIIDTDNYSQSIEFPGWISSIDEEIKILPGDNIMCVFPFKRDDWKMKITLDKNLLEDSIVFRFLSKCYRTFFWNKKHYD